MLTVKQKFWAPPRPVSLREELLSGSSWRTKFGALFNVLIIHARRTAKVTFSTSACYGLYRAGILDKETAERWAGGVTFVDAPKLVV